MTLNTLKDNFKKIIDYTLLESNILNVSMENKLKEIENYFQEKPADIKNFFNDIPKNNTIFYIKYFQEIIKKIDIDYLEITNLLNSNIFFELKYSLFDKLTNKEKIAYLENKKVNNDDISLINYTLKKKRNIIDNLIDLDLLNIIPNNSLELNYNLANKKDLTNKKLIIKLTKSSYSKIVLKYFYLASDFIAFLKNNPYILEYLDNYSIGLEGVIKEELNKIVLQYPLLIEKLDYLLSINYLTKDTLDKINNYDYIVKEILMAQNKLDPNEVLNKSISKVEDKKLPIYDNRINQTNRDLIFNNYNYLRKFSDITITSMLNKYGTEEEIVAFLRNEEFINNLKKEYLVEVLNNIGLKVAFNMLQNINILEKVDNLDIKIKDNEEIFIPGFLDSYYLVSKSSHSLIKRMLDKVSNQEYYLLKPYILIKLTNNELISSLVNCHIKSKDIYYKKDIINRLNNQEITILINKMWQKWGFDLSYIDANYQKNLIGIDVSEFNKIKNEIIYIYELLISRSNNLVINPNISLTSFKSIICAYKLLGLKNLENLINNGNKNITLDAVIKVKKDYINKFSNNYWDLLLEENNPMRWLEEIKKINLKSNDKDILKRIIQDNYLLNNMLNMMEEYNYSTKDNTLNILIEYYDYLEYNLKKANNLLLDFFNHFNAYLYKLKRNELQNNFDNKIKKRFQLKNEIINNIQKKLGREFIKEYQFKILVYSLKKKDKYEKFYKESTFKNLENNYKKAISKEDFNLEDIITSVLEPYLNTKDYKECLLKKNIKIPSMYNEYQEFILEEKKLEKINIILIDLLKGLHKTKVINILNYLCYHSPINFYISDSLILKLNNIRKEIINFKGKVDVNKSLLRLDYTKSLYFSNEEEIEEYNSYIDIIEEIIIKSQKYAYNNVSEIEIKANFRKEYTKYINDFEYNYKINNKNYILRKRMFLLDDLNRVFQFLDINKVTRLSKKQEQLFFKNKFFELLLEGYFDDYLEFLPDIINKNSLSPNLFDNFLN